MSQEKKIFSIDEINDPGSKGLNIDLNGESLELFIVKKNSQITVYENSCPHTQGPLDWTPDQFLDLDNNYIQCANHGALFEINNGLCIYGPCKNQSLKALPFKVRDNFVYLMI